VDSFHNGVVQVPQEVLIAGTHRMTEPPNETNLVLLSLREEQHDGYVSNPVSSILDFNATECCKINCYYNNNR
jgi:hypothetical protein